MFHHHHFYSIQFWKYELEQLNRKGKKGIRKEKEEIKSSLLANGNDTLCRKPKTLSKDF